MADDRQANGQQRARSEALYRSEDDELVHVAGEPREHRAEDENEKPAEIQRFASVDVGEAPEERRRDGRDEEVRREHEGITIDAAELTDHGRHRGPHDGLVESRDEAADHHHGDPGRLLARHRPKRPPLNSVAWIASPIFWRPGELSRSSSSRRRTTKSSDCSAERSRTFSRSILPSSRSPTGVAGYPASARRASSSTSPRTPPLR